MHVFTLRNMMWNTVHMILRTVFHPKGCPFAPCKTMENICEHHFSQKKLGNSASPSIAACIYSTHKTHMKQLKKSFHSSSCSHGHGHFNGASFRNLSESLLLASRFESVCSVGISAETLRKQLAEWLGLLWVANACSQWMSMVPSGYQYQQHPTIRESNLIIHHHVILY